MIKGKFSALSRRQIIVGGVALLALAGLAFLVAVQVASFAEFELRVLPYSYAMRRFVESRYIEFVSLGLALLGLFLVLTGYLRSDPDSAKAAEFSVNAAELRVEKSELHRHMNRSEDDESPQRQTEPLPGVVLSTNLIEDTLAAPLDPRELRIGALFDATQARLRNEIGALGQRSTINLAVGVTVTVAATCLLVYLVTRQHPDFDKVATVLSFYIPRVTTVVLIETFAYFFLGLYRANLAEIKFYQNERTTIAALEIAWRASLWPETGGSTAMVVEQLARTDRNPTLSTDYKGATSDQLQLVEILKSISTIAVESLKSKTKGE